MLSQTEAASGHQLASTRPTFLPLLRFGSWKLVLHFRGWLLTFTLAAIAEIKACAFAQAECRLCCQNEVNIWLRCSSALMLPSQISPAQSQVQKKPQPPAGQLCTTTAGFCCLCMHDNAVCADFILSRVPLLSHPVLPSWELYYMNRLRGLLRVVVSDSPCGVSRLIDLLSASFCEEILMPLLWAR